MRQDRQDDVLAYRLGQQEALVAAVLGYQRQPDARPQGIARGLDAAPLAIDLDRPLRVQCPVERQQELRLALALQSADTQNLAFLEVERDALQTVAVLQIAHPQQASSGRGRPFLWVEALAHAAQHHVHDLVVVQRPHGLRADMPAVAKHRDDIGDHAHFSQAVGDEDHNGAARGKPPAQAEQLNRGRG